LLKKQDNLAMAEAVQAAYEAGEDDKSLEPRVLVDALRKPIGRFQDGDYVIFYNLRGEREVERCRSCRCRPAEAGRSGDSFSFGQFCQYRCRGPYRKRSGHQKGHGERGFSAGTLPASSLKNWSDRANHRRPRDSGKMAKKC
jgi:hypothetical protein